MMTVSKAKMAWISALIAAYSCGKFGLDVMLYDLIVGMF